MLAMLSSCGEKNNAPQRKPDPPTVVDVIVARNGSIPNIIEANGTVVANEYVELHPEVSGRITYLNVPEGKQVAAGTIIARINDADLRAQLEKSKVQLDLAQKTEQRLSRLLAINGVNQADYDAAVNQVNSLRADISYTQTLIDKTIVRAPFSGVVGLRQVSLGAYVVPSNIIATVQQVDKVKVDFTLPEEYSSAIKKGNTVEVEADAARQSRKKAIIIATEPQVNQNTRNLKVRAVLQNSTGNLGAFVKVYLTASADKKAILVPTNALIPNDRNNQLILVKKGKASFVDVRTGVREASNVEVLSGVNEGDTVVVTGVLFARPKSPVRIRQVKQIDEVASDQ